MDIDINLAKAIDQLALLQGQIAIVGMASSPPDDYRYPNLRRLLANALALAKNAPADSLRGLVENFGRAIERCIVCFELGSDPKDALALAADMHEKEIVPLLRTIG